MPLCIRKVHVLYGVLVLVLGVASSSARPYSGKIYQQWVVLSALDACPCLWLAGYWPMGLVGQRSAAQECGIATTSHLSLGCFQILYAALMAI